MIPGGPYPISCSAMTDFSAGAPLSFLPHRSAGFDVSACHPPAHEKKGRCRRRRRPFTQPLRDTAGDDPAGYFTSSILTTFSYMERIGIRQPYFQILTRFPFSRMASFWMFPESNLNRYLAS